MKRMFREYLVQALAMAVSLAFLLMAGACTRGSTRQNPTGNPPASTSTAGVITSIAEATSSAETTSIETSSTGTLPSLAGKPAFSQATYPRIDGSTATIPLSENIAASLLGLTSSEAKLFIKHNTTHNAYVNLIDGKADLILVTEPSADELKLAAEKGVKLEVIPIVKEAFVFLVNKANPVDTLSQQQIQEIYQGRITNWKMVSGPDLEIIAYQRPDNSGSQTLMQALVMKNLKLAPAPTELKPDEMAGLIERIAAYDNSERAIGYSVYYYANSMYNKETIKFVKIDGIEPNNQTISGGTYPYTSAYYAVMKETEPADSSARKLVAWILSAEGQKLAESSGYVPLKLVEK